MRYGLTLIEVIVTLVLLGIVLAVVPAASPRAQRDTSAWSDNLRLAQHDAITSGRSVHGYNDTLGLYTARPDGSLLIEHLPETDSRGARAR